MHMSAKYLLPLALLAGFLPGAAPAAEDPLLVLVRLLRDNGTLSEQAYRTMREAIKARLAQQSLPPAPATRKPEHEPAPATICIRRLRTSTSSPT